MEYIQLTPEHSPLVELATRLGYAVYCDHSEHSLQATQPHYHIDNGLGRYCDGDDLVDILTFMIKRDLLSITSPVT